MKHILLSNISTAWVAGAAKSIAFFSTDMFAAKHDEATPNVTVIIRYSENSVCHGQICGNRDQQGQVLQPDTSLLHRQSTLLGENKPKQHIYHCGWTVGPTMRDHSRRPQSMIWLKRQT